MSETDRETGMGDGAGKGSGPGGDTEGPRAGLIRRRLVDAFAPVDLAVIDDSESHRGHAGFREEGESHFRVRIRAEAFAGLSRIARHRAVHAALGPELVAEIHALSLDIDTPREAPRDTPRETPRDAP